MGIQRALSLRLERFSSALGKSGCTTPRRGSEAGEAVLPRRSTSSMSSMSSIGSSSSLTNSGSSLCPPQHAQWLDSRALVVVASLAAQLEGRAECERRAAAKDVFLCASTPALPLASYVTRLAGGLNMQCGAATCASFASCASPGVRATVLAKVYVDRVAAKGYCINRLNAHRLTAAAFLLAACLLADAGCEPSASAPGEARLWARLLLVQSEDLVPMQAALFALLGRELAVSEFQYADAELAALRWGRGQ
jgi:hypothetical protein